MEGGVGGLDERLDESLGDFDETVLSGTEVPNEQGVDILDPVGTGDSANASDQPIFEEGDLDEGDSMGGMGENTEVAQRAEAGGASSSGGGGGGAAPSGAAGSGSATGSGSGSQGAVTGVEDIIPVPEDVGDGRNDDIVLRQIRDAATHEKDPVLRERLWDEYRRIQAQR